MSNYPTPVKTKITHAPTKTTSITIRFNNGEISQGIEVLRAFCAVVLNQDTTPTPNAIADAMLKNLDRWRE